MQEILCKQVAYCIRPINDSDTNMQITLTRGLGMHSVKCQFMNTQD